MRKQIAAGLLSTSLFTAGCEFSISEEPEKNSSPPTAEAAPITIVALGAQATTAGLPEGVRRQLPSVVKIKQPVPEGILAASGVKVKGGFITAGHFLKTEDNFWRLSCASPSIEPNNITRPDKALWRVAAKYHINSTEGTDIAYMSPAAAEKYTEATVREAPHDLPQGQEVFFVNYEPTPRKKDRGYDMKGRNKGPAIYSGYVLDDPAGSSDQIAVMTTVGRSFGDISDTESRPGASGGGVFANDELVAVTSGVNDRGKIPIAEIEQTFNVEIWSPGTNEAQITYVQPVSGVGIKELATQAKPRGRCAD